MTKASNGIEQNHNGQPKSKITPGNDGLTQGQSDFVKGISNGLGPQKAAMQAFPNQSYGSAAVTANRLLNNVKILDRLSEIDLELEDTMLDVLRVSRKHYTTHKRAYDGELTLKTASYLHDKRYGKPKQQVEVQSTAVSIKIDLSGKASAS